MDVWSLGLWYSLPLFPLWIYKLLHTQQSQGTSSSLWLMIAPRISFCTLIFSEWQSLSSGGWADNHFHHGAVEAVPWSLACTWWLCCILLHAWFGALAQVMSFQTAASLALQMMQQSSFPSLAFILIKVMYDHNIKSQIVLWHCILEPASSSPVNIPSPIFKCPNFHHF